MSKAKSRSIGCLGWFAISFFALISLMCFGNDWPVAGTIFLALTACVWLFSSSMSKVTNEQGDDYLNERRSVPRPPLASGASPGYRKSQPHEPSPPTTIPVEPWGQTRTTIEVVGERYRKNSIRRLIKDIGLDSSGEGVTTEPAELVSDFENPHDNNAVAVWVHGVHLGYLPREEAREWAPAVREMLNSGEHLVVPARTWFARRAGELYARVTVWVPEKSEVKPVNQLPASPYAILPKGSTLQVTKEEDHMDTLTKHIESGSISVAATLHAIWEIRPRSAVEVVEVRLDNERIGILTTTTSAHMLPVVKFFEERNMLPVSRATLKGNTLKIDATLHCAKSQELDPVWLESFGPKLRDLDSAPPPKRPEFEWED